MTSKAEFSAEEWDLVSDAPMLAGFILATAQRGGSISESFSMAKSWVEARQTHGDSELLDAIVAEKPEVDRKRFGSREELHTKGLEQLGQAVALLEEKATPEEVETYKQFVITLAQRVAEANKEGGFLGIGGEKVSDAEQARLAEIAATLGVEPPAPAPE